MSLISRIKEHISSPQRLMREESDPQITEWLRASLLELVQAHSGDAVIHLRRRIGCAATVQSLFFMRSEVMAVLSPLLGEAEAMQKVELACAPFRNALPSCLRSRPSPLGRA